MPECVNNDSMRSDNLKGHLQGKHKMSEESERKKHIDFAKRMSAMAVGGNERSRRRLRRESISDSMTVIDEVADGVCMD